MNQVITIKPDGSLVGLDHKKKGLDLRQFGKAAIRRVTLIEWHDDLQMWFIKWAEGMSQQGKVWDSSMFIACGVQWGAYNGVTMLDPDDSVFFNDYEDAVSAEVAVIQSIQLSGKGAQIFR